jgi:environmental stress-induced protein Ves
MAFRVLRRRDHSSMAWRNGGGRTLEVISEPPGSGLDDFGWRVSFADVAAAGPFSAFPGVDRVLTLVHGDMTLSVDGTEIPIAPFAPYAFGGEAAVAGVAGGPSVDLNLMTRRGQFVGEVECVSLECGTRTITPPTSASQSLIAVLQGHLRVLAPTGASVELSALDVLTDVDAPVVLGGTGTVAVVTVCAGSGAQHLSA